MEYHQGRMGQLCSHVRSDGRLGRHETDSNRNGHDWKHHWFGCRCDVVTTEPNRIQGRISLDWDNDDWTIVDAFQNAIQYG